MTRRTFVPLLAAALLAPALLTGCSKGRRGPKGNVALPPAQFASVAFDQRIDVPGGQFAVGVVVADLDGDTRADVLVTRYSESRITFFRSLGNGLFAPGVDLPPGPLFALGIAVGDLNSDGALDVIATDYENDMVYVYAGAGNGTFGLPGSFSTAEGPIGLAIADFDLDGLRDIAVCGLKEREVKLHRGLGGLTFSAGSTRLAPGTPVDMVAVDVNGDAQPELLFTDIEVNTLECWRVQVPTADGGEVIFEPYASAATGVQPVGVAAGNLDGGAELEFVVGAIGSASVQVFRFTGGDLVPIGSVLTSAPNAGVALGDVNDDGRLDLVAAGAGTDSVAIALGNGDGTFGAVQTRTTGRAPIFVGAGDVTGDGIADVVAGCSLSGQITAHAGSSSGPTGPPAFFGGFSPQFAAAGDLDGDSREDLVVGDAATGEIRFFRNTGNLEVAAFPSKTIQLPSAKAFKPLVLDIDGDGDLDVVALHANGLSILRNLGNFDFVVAGTLSTPQELLYGVVADVTKDKILDVVVTSPDANEVRVYRGTGTSLELFTTFTAGPKPAGVDVGDFDRDGDLDIVVAHLGGSTVSIARRKVNGTYVPNTVVLDVGQSPTYVRAADLDGDNRIDLVVAHAEGADILTFRNLGGFKFDDPSVYATNGHPAGLLVEDLDIDTRVDLLYTESTTGRATFRRTQADGSFAAPTANLAVQYFVVTPLLVDLDDDGKRDLVTTSDVSTLLEIHRNLSK